VAAVAVQLLVDILRPVNPSSWTDPAIIVQAVAVVVAAVAAFAVIWQAVLTRSALTDANRSLVIARDSLEVAREAQAHAALLSVEAIKARIAVNAPSADLEARRDSLRLLAPSTVPSGYPQEWPGEHIFHIKDSSQAILVRVPVTLRNTSNRATRFTLWGALRKSMFKPGAALVEMVGTEPGPQDVLLEAGEKVDGYWEVSKTLAEWIAIYDDRQGGNPGPESEFTAYVDDGHDNGGSYWFTLLMGGTVVRPSAPGLRETWILIAPSETDEIGIGRRPVKARYWISKMQELELHESGAEIISGTRA